jgi:Ca2+-binding RTX toxin-like protein
MKRVVLLVAAIAIAVVLASGVAWAATIVGTNGDDTRTGTENRDFMYGLNGDDTLVGRGGNDVIEGGGDRDILRGGDGNDEVSGGPGRDEIYLGASSVIGQNEAYGGSGADFINADNGTFDEVYAGSGSDFIDADDGTPDVVDCGMYESPTSANADYDSIDVDSVDQIEDCENVF